jgi:hypothetical protein
MPALTIASTILTGGSVLSGIFGASKAKKAARRKAEEEAAAEGEVTAERVRQIDVEEKALRGETIAKTAASGIKTTSGTTISLLAEQAYEFEKERAITEKVGASKATSALARGNSLAAQIDSQAIGSSVSQLTSLFSILSNNKSKTGSYFGI